MSNAFRVDPAFAGERVFQYFSSTNESGQNSFRETVRDAANKELADLWALFKNPTGDLVKSQALVLFCMFSQDRQAVKRQDWLKSMTDFVKRNLPLFEVVGAAFSVAESGGATIGWDKNGDRLTDDFKTASQMAFIMANDSFDGSYFRGTIADIFEAGALSDFKKSYNEALPSFAKLLRGEELSPSERNPLKGMFEKLKFALTSIRADLAPQGTNAESGVRLDISADALAARLTQETQAATNTRQKLERLIGDIPNFGQMLRN